MVTKRKGGKLGLKLFPKTPNLEAVSSHCYVVQEHHSTGPELWKPGLEVVCHGIVGMQAVDVQHVKATVFKFRDGLIEGHSKQVRERSIVSAVVLFYVD